MLSKKLSAYLMLVLCSFFWSGNFIVGKYASLFEVPPLTLNFLRWLIIWIILVPFTYKDILKNFKNIKKYFYILIPISITGVSIFNSVVYYALNFTQVINGALMISTIPVFIIFISFLFKTEKININQIIGIILSFLGVVIIITKFDLQKLIHLNINKGDFLLLIAMLSWATYSTLLKTYKLPFKSLTFIQIIVSIGLVFLLPQFLFELHSQITLPINLPVFFILSYVVLFAGLGAYLFWNSAVNIVGPNHAGIFLHLMPVFSSFMAIFFFHEIVMNFHIIGALIIILGIYISSRENFKI